MVYRCKFQFINSNMSNGFNMLKYVSYQIEGLVGVTGVFFQRSQMACHFVPLAVVVVGHDGDVVQVARQHRDVVCLEKISTSVFYGNCSIKLVSSAILMIKWASFSVWVQFWLVKLRPGQ